MCAEDMNNERDDGKVTKESFKDYTYVMVSTLNQMVNYIPLKHFDCKFKEVVNITINDSLYGDNAKWDTNLTDVLGSGALGSSITFKQSEITNLTTIKNRLNEQLKGKEKIFWNITGGQRPFVLAIQQIAKADDVICYLEGNNSQMVLLQNNHEIEDVKSYSLEGLTIETALKLMGFDIKVTKTSHRNLLANHDKAEKTFYLKFLKKYINDANLRKNCILLNRDDKKENAKKEIKKVIAISDDELNQNKAFGFILEKLAGYKILEVANGKIADITFGEKINYLRDEDKADEYHIDEFDIALLTKNGKFMIFECKSGGMEGDVAKSTKYSTYAVSGVYGLPILITPLLESEINDIDKLDKDTYGYIQNAVKSAKRASLEVWGIDEIEKHLKKYIEL
ncbi:MAG: hypothetical protein WA080_10465 [Sulfuricurvum sp.]